MSRKIPKHLKKSSHPSSVFRIAIVLAAGALLNMAWYASPGVFSFFSHEGSAEGTASAASSFLKSASIEEGAYASETNSSINTTSSTIIRTEDSESKSNVSTESKIRNTNSDYPKSIVIRKKEDTTGEPIVFFSVEGPVSQYIRSINPAVLSEKSEYYDKNSKSYRIPIPVGVSFHQWLNLFGMKDGVDDIKGTITIKYLNNFINYPVDVTLHPSYLRKVAGIVNDSDGVQSVAKHHKSGKGQPFKDELNKEITCALLNVARYNEWKPVEIPEMTQETGAIQVPALNLTQSQSMIMDVVMPGLKGWIDYIYNFIKNQQDQIAKKDNEINHLNTELKKQAERNDALHERIGQMRADMDKLHKELESKEDIDTSQQVNDSTADENTAEITDGSSKMTANGETQGTAENNTQETLNDSTQASPGSSTPEVVNNNSDEGTNGITPESTNGSLQETSIGITQDSAENGQQGITNDSTSKALESGTQGASNSSTAGSTSGSQEQPTNNNASETANNKVQETVSNNMPESTNNNTQGATNARQ